MRALVASVVLTLFSLYGAVPSALGQDTSFSFNGQCVASGPFLLTDLPIEYADFRPSVRRQLSAIGYTAINVGCVPSLECKVASQDTEVRRQARKPCAAAARAMVQTLPSQKRQIATKAITIRVVTSTEEEAGTYLTMTPGVIDLSGAKAPIGGARPLSN